MLDVEWNSETFTALRERALWWPARSTLLVADLHLGKAASFRHFGVPVPEAATAADLDRLSSIISRFRPERLVILGDLIHARSGRAPECMSAFAHWRSRYAELDVLLIRGNHDRSAGDPPADWNLRIADEPHADAPSDTLALAHHPDQDSDERPFFCGHLHPGVRLHGGVGSIRCPVFWFTPRRAMLPAFGSFTGLALVSPGPEDTVLAVGPDAVVHLRPHVQTGNDRRVAPAAPRS